MIINETDCPIGVVTLDICTGPEFSSPPFFFSLFFLRLCRLSFFPFCNKMLDILYLQYSNSYK